MTKADLMQLKKLIAEKDDLEQRLLTLKFNPNEELADTVKDYRTGFPKTIIIRGYGDNNWQKLHSKWAEKLAITAKRVQDMEAFLDSIKDAEIRQILRLRYIDGLSQEEVGRRMGYSRPAIQKKEERFWEEQYRKE